MDEREIDKQPGRARPGRLRLPVWAGTIAVIAGALVLVVVLVSRFSSGPRACPAVGYANLLEVVLTGDTGDVAHLQVHEGDEHAVWQPSPATGPDAAEPSVPPRDGDTWTFTLFYPPDQVGLRALDEAGEVLAQTEKNVDWVRVGGSEECGGPMEGRIGWAL
ncbi:hypothetical protein ACFVSK_13725 [Cellulosimicrobium cellulans]|uniref:hypothetical protein n=1 Tax=Cellulosimicrobium cellulans TaxID=1710 RepID=UPI0036E7D4D4